MSGDRRSRDDAKRIASEADELIQADVARTAATGRLGKGPIQGTERTDERGLALGSTLGSTLPPGMRRWGCILLAVVLLALLAVAVVILGGGGSPPTAGQETPSPTATASPQPPAESVAPGTAPGTQTLADYAHALAPPDVTSVSTDDGGTQSYLYEVTSSRELADLDAHYQAELPRQGWEIGNTRRFDSRVIFEIDMAAARVTGLVSLEPATNGTRVQITVAMPPPDGGGGGRLTSPDPPGDVVTDSGTPVDDPEVDITATSFQKVGDSYRITVTLAAGLVLDWSFALLVDAGNDEEAVHYIYQTHGRPAAMLIGQIDPRTGQILAGAAEGVLIAYDRSTGMATFEFPGSQLPDGTDRYRVSSFHAPTETDERRTDQTNTINIGFLICGGACR